jgi:hypothetical protein
MAPLGPIYNIYRFHSDNSESFPMRRSAARSWWQRDALWGRTGDRAPETGSNSSAVDWFGSSLSRQECKRSCLDNLKLKRLMCDLWMWYFVGHCNINVKFLKDCIIDHYLSVVAFFLRDKTKWSHKTLQRMWNHKYLWNPTTSTMIIVSSDHCI